MLESAGRGLLHPLLRSIGTISPSSDKAGVQLLTHKLVDQYQHDIESKDPGGRVFLLHTLLPHNPYVFDAEGQFSSDKTSNFVRTRSPTPSEFAATWPRYREQIRYADTILGEIIDTLERRGLYDRATLIVTSDHGLRLSYPTAEHAIEMPLLTPEVPMFIRSPRVQPRKSDIDYQHVDFGPTLLDLLGIQSPGLLAPRDDLPGPSVRISALSENRTTRDKVFFAPATGVYWEYVYSDALHVWENREKVDHPIGDRTDLKAK
jgi:arylsulfatase A-like enzyme